MVLAVVALLIGISRFLSSADGEDRSIHALKVVIRDPITAREVLSENGVLTPVQQIEVFSPADHQIYVCYELESSEPITMTYWWYYESTLIFTYTSPVKTGGNCTGLHVSGPGSLKTGNYHVYFSFGDLMLAGTANFAVRENTGWINHELLPRLAKTGRSNGWSTVINRSIMLQL